MNHLVDFYTHGLPRSPHEATRLDEEIAYLEARLHAMNGGGDCAYEHAMSRSYSDLLKVRRRELAALKN